MGKFAQWGKPTVNSTNYTGQSTNATDYTGPTVNATDYTGPTVNATDFTAQAVSSTNFIVDYILRGIILNQVDGYILDQNDNPIYY